jgi:DNA polymerase (family X)
MPLTKDEIAARLKEIGAYLRLVGQDPYRARAYENAGDALDALGPEFEVLVDSERMTEVPGIGASIAGVIGELRRTGSTRKLEELRAEFPPSLLELAQVPGMTITRVRALHAGLGIEGLDDLQQAAAAGKLRELKGFGAKTEQKILEGIERYRNRPARRRLIDARDIALPLAQRLRVVPGVVALEVAGAVRRWKETVGTLRMVASAAEPGRALAALIDAAGHARVEGREGEASPAGPQEVRLWLPAGLPLELTVVPPALFASALVRTTGSKAHVDRLALRAARGGQDLAALAVPDEAAVYAALGLPFIPPELREDAGELEAAEAGDDFADLITAGDIRGMTHCHTTHSDGRASVLQMARAGSAMGMGYMTITDHSPTAGYAGGLTVDRLPAQWAEIDAAQAETGLRLLRGTESDILADGRLDYPDDVLARFQVVIASIHNRMGMDEDQMTDRLVRMMRLPQFKIWGHGLGRLILRRDPIACRVEEVLAAAAQSRAAIEINGDPYRLDLPPEWARRARQLGLAFVISTDAHSTSDLENLPYGIAMARRAGIRKREVLNVMAAGDFAAAVAPAGT